MCSTPMLRLKWYFISERIILLINGGVPCHNQFTECLLYIAYFNIPGIKHNMVMDVQNVFVYGEIIE